MIASDRRISNSYLHQYDFIDREKPIQSITDSPIKGSVSARVAHVQPPPDKLPFNPPFPPPFLPPQKSKEKKSNRRLSNEATPSEWSAEHDEKETKIDDDRLHDIHNANGMFSCFCSVCFGASKKSVGNTLHVMPTILKQSMKKIEMRTLFTATVQGEKQDFLWLMTHLLPSTEKLKGCELIFPDTVFFENGKPKIIIRTDRQSKDKDFCLQGVKSAARLQKDSILKDFPAIYRERKKDDRGIFRQKYGDHIKLPQKFVPFFVQ